MRTLEGGARLDLDWSSGPVPRQVPGQGRRRTDEGQVGRPRGVRGATEGGARPEVLSRSHPKSLTCLANPRRHLPSFPTEP